jgi:hypothetical protein
VRLVVFIVPARAEVHLRGRGIDTMWRRSLTQRPGRHVVCFVVLKVVARGDVRVRGADVASGPVLVHVQPPSIGTRTAAERSPSLIIRAIEDRRHGCCVVNGFVNETRSNCRDGVKRGAMPWTGDRSSPAGLRPGRGLETATGWLITQRSQVRILSPLLKVVVLTRPYGRRRVLAAVRFVNACERAAAGVCRW